MQLSNIALLKRIACLNVIKLMLTNETAYNVLLPRQPENTVSQLPLTRIQMHLLKHARQCSIFPDVTARWPNREQTDSSINSTQEQTKMDEM